MGTPQFAVPTLEALIASGHGVALAVTQPDRPRDRRRLLASPPVKDAALLHGIAVAQPPNLRDPAFLALLRSLAPEAIVVAAYGRILPGDILSLPKYGCINLHASLLPKFRGAAPIQRALMDGEEETGVTTILMDKGMDTGDILLQKRTSVGAEENFGSLYARLALLGAELIVETLLFLSKGTLGRQPQDHAQATLAPQLTAEDETIDWQRTAAAIRNQVRALDPWPGARTSAQGKLLKIWRASVKPGDVPGVPGEVLTCGAEGVDVRTGGGILRIEELQIAGGVRLPAREYLRGHRLPEGTVLGAHEI
jgi:methionyl-tRNA formyltransferase